MAFDIVCYQMTAEKNRVDKTNYLGTGTTLTGTLRASCDLLKPVIDMQLTAPPTFNYCYISAFHRYYYVTGIVAVVNNMYRVSLSCDPLMSWKTQIGNVMAIIQRQENEYNLYMDDGSFKAYNYPQIQLKEFPNGFPSPTYILALAGGNT